MIYVAVESLYSLHGDEAPLVSMLKLCEQYNAFIYVDEAHSFGVRGRNGCGLMYELNLQKHPNVCAIMVSYSKSLACTGGAILCNSDVVIEYLKQYALTSLYSNFMPLAMLLSIECGYNYLQSDVVERRRVYLKELIVYFKDVYATNSFSQIQPIIVGDARLTRLIHQKCNGLNILLIPAYYPFVPKGQSLLRVYLHSFNTKQQIDTVVKVLHKYKKQQSKL